VAYQVRFPPRRPGLLRAETDQSVSQRHDDMKDLRCMSFTSKGTSEVLAAGLQDTMFVVDVAKGSILKQVRTPGSICSRAAMSTDRARFRPIIIT
jgi:hypothetical protein